MYRYVIFEVFSHCEEDGEGGGDGMACEIFDGGEEGNRGMGSCYVADSGKGRCNTTAAWTALFTTSVLELFDLKRVASAESLDLKRYRLCILWYVLAAYSSSLFYHFLVYVITFSICLCLRLLCRRYTIRSFFLIIPMSLKTSFLLLFSYVDYPTKMLFYSVRLATCVNLYCQYAGSLLLSGCFWKKSCLLWSKQ